MTINSFEEFKRSPSQELPPLQAREGDGNHPESGIHTNYLNYIQGAPNTLTNRLLLKALKGRDLSTLNLGELVKKTFDNATSLVSAAMPIIKNDPNYADYSRIINSNNLQAYPKIDEIADVISERRAKNVVECFEHLQRERCLPNLPIFEGTDKEKAAGIRRWLKNNEITMTREDVFLGDLSSIPKEVLLIRNLGLETLDKALSRAMTIKDVEFMGALISNEGKLNQIRLEKLEHFLKSLALVGNEKLVQRLTRSNRWRDITPRCALAALMLATPNHPKVARILIELDIIPPFQLAFVLEDAVSSDTSEILRMLIPRLSNMPNGYREDLDKALKKAASAGHQEAVHALIHSRLLPKFSANGLGRALLEATYGEHEPVMQTLVDSTRAHEIPLYFLVKARLFALIIKRNPRMAGILTNSLVDAVMKINPIHALDILSRIAMTLIIQLNTSEGTLNRVIGSGGVAFLITSIWSSLFTLEEPE